MLVAMVAVVVCVVALQELDVVTNQGAALATFAVLTVLNLPEMIGFMAPVALFLALLMTLNRLSAESEIVVVNASGGSPTSILRPVLSVAIIVALLVSIIAHFVAPPSQRAWRYVISEVRADLLASVAREGAFSQLQNGLTFHMRARQPGGILADIMIADTRSYPEETLYFAQRGTVARSEGGSFLSLEDGFIQRRTVGESGRISTAYLFFDTYAIDLSFAAGTAIPGFFKPSEQSTAYLMAPDADDPLWLRDPVRFASELHQRFALPLYPIAFAVIVVAALGTPHSARGGRGARVLWAIGGSALALGLQFAAVSLTEIAEIFMVLLYLVPVLVVAVCWPIISGHQSAQASKERSWLPTSAPRKRASR